MESLVFTSVEWAIIDSLHHHQRLNLLGLQKDLGICPQIIFRSLQYLIIRGVISYYRQGYHLNALRFKELVHHYQDQKNLEQECSLMVKTCLQDRESMGLKRIRLDKDDLVILKSYFKQIQKFIEDAKKKKSKEQQETYLLFWGQQAQKNVLNCALNL